MKQIHHGSNSLRVLELQWFATGVSWYDAKLGIVREAIQAYLAAPCYSLNLTA